MPVGKPMEYENSDYGAGGVKKPPMKGSYGKGMSYPKKKRRKPGTSRGSTPSPVQQATMSLLANKKKAGKYGKSMDYK